MAFYCGSWCTGRLALADILCTSTGRGARDEGFVTRFPPGTPQLVSSSPSSPPASPKGFQGRCHPLLVQAAHPHRPPGASQHSCNPVNVKPGGELEEG